jgi:hypothetical protein
MTTWISIDLYLIWKINQSDRKSSNYKDYYTQDLIDKVGEIYKEDIKLFNLTY